MFSRISIRTRLWLLVGALALLFALAALQTVHHVRNASATLKTLYDDRVVPLKQLKTVADVYAIGVVDAAHKVRDGAFTPEQGRKAVADARTTARQQWTAYVATELNDQEKALIEKAGPILKTADDAAQRVGELMAGEKAELARFAAVQMYPAIDPLGDLIAALIQVQLDVAAAEYDKGKATAESVILTNSVGALMVLLCAGLLAWRLVRSIADPLGEAIAVAEQVASGNLGSRIDASGTDETGKLLGALQRMNRNLAEIVSQVRQGSELIATGSSQIAAGNADLSQRTEKQAASLEQTAASLEQLTAAVNNNAQAARNARQIAASASEVVAQGGTAVGRVVATMDEIGASSKRIADITSIIDGIAFQTNILALNAAVEAARAGEQGRGFAVVASEVRALAQRSAAAAKEIKDLIGESVAQVQAGSSLVGEAGDTMREIMEQVRRVTALIDDISHSSQEQSQGIGQLGDAMTQLDQVTQQNAALVEEAAAAAESLREQAANMANTVSVFTLHA